MSVCYELQPLDTLFFRGTIPLQAGMLSTGTLFPPPLSVVTGALRTALLMQHQDLIRNWKQGTCAELNSIAGHYGADDAPFRIIALCLRKIGADGTERWYVPAPAVWYADCKDKLTDNSKLPGCSIISAAVRKQSFDALSVCSSAGTVPFVVPVYEAQSLAGWWVSLQMLQHSVSGGYKIEDAESFVPPSELYSYESRTGIALDRNRAVIKRQLYTAQHIRLAESVSLVVVTDRDIGLQDKSLISLGGERRLCALRILPSGQESAFFATKPQTRSTGWWYSPIPVPVTEENVACVIASGKTSIIGGWDMKKGFHKPSQTWIPAGAVFSKNIQSVCVPLC